MISKSVLLDTCIVQLVVGSTGFTASQTDTLEGISLHICGTITVEGFGGGDLD